MEFVFVSPFFGFALLCVVAGISQWRNPQTAWQRARTNFQHLTPSRRTKDWDTLNRSYSTDVILLGVVLFLFGCYLLQSFANRPQLDQNLSNIHIVFTNSTGPVGGELTLSKLNLEFTGHNFPFNGGISA
jgi:hypothetical protein